MTVIGLDASSTLTGFAASAGPGRIVEHGVFRPNRTRDEAFDRAIAMAMDAVELVRLHVPEVIVVETPSLRAPRHGRGRQGQANYGLAVGVMLGTLWAHVERRKLVLVRADVWTRGSSKELRAEMLLMTIPGLSFEGDTGLDAADAVGLTEWWWEVGQHKQEVER